jgi:thioredoxin 1
MAITNLKNNNFQAFVNNNDKVLIDFYADWCGPCKMLSPVIESLSNKHKNVSFAKVNVDQESQIAQSYNISSIPTVLLFKNGKLVNRFSGYRSELEIEKIINNI